MQPWTPAVIRDQLALWVEGGSSANYSLSGDDINQWTDLSGRGNHLTPATSLKPKRIGNGTFFSTGADALFTPEFANPTGADGISFFLTVEAESAFPVTWSNVLTKGSVNEQWSLIFENLAEGNQAIIRSALTDSAFSSVKIGTDMRVVSGSIRSSGMSLNFNGTQVASAGAVVRNFLGSSRLTVGSSPTNNYANNRYYGRIGDLVVTNRALSADDFVRMEGYLAWLRSLQGSFPVGHAYANAAPTAYGYTGSVLDSSGDPAARLIRCYRDSDGALVAETTSSAGGAYALAVPTNEAHSLIASGESARNSLILAGVMPG